jgi:Tfp pilus assembly protein PilP
MINLTSSVIQVKKTPVHLQKTQTKYSDFQLYRVTLYSFPLLSKPFLPTIVLNVIYKNKNDENNSKPNPFH